MSSSGIKTVAQMFQCLFTLTTQGQLIAPFQTQQQQQQEGLSPQSEDDMNDCDDVFETFHSFVFHLWEHGRIDGVEQNANVVDVHLSQSHIP